MMDTLEPDFPLAYTVYLVPSSTLGPIILISLV